MKLISDSLCQHYAEDDAADDGNDVVGFALWVMQRVVCIDCALCDWVHGYLLVSLMGAFAPGFLSGNQCVIFNPAFKCCFWGFP